MDEKFMQEQQQENEVQDAPGNLREHSADQEEAIDNKSLEIEKLNEQLAELKDKYLRQVADFDNFRKRTAKERLELMQTAGKDVISALLTVLDDSERAEKQLQTSQDINTIREGVSLVFGKLRNTLQSRGLKAMDSVGADFNPDIHEAITEVPVPNEALKGKVIDEVEKGYYLNDKIIRFAKVVVGK